MLMNNTKTIILKDKAQSYFLKYLKEENIINELYYFNTNKFIFKLLNKLKINIYGNWSKHIKEYNKFIIFDTLYNTRISKKIKRKNPDCEIILYFWNKINNLNKDFLKDNLIDDFYTFDKEDAEKYKIKYNSQFYTNKIKLEENEKTIDVLFLGRAKTRKSQILNYEKQMNDVGLKTKILIIENEKDFIEYEEYLKMLSRAKAILDIVDGNQRGLTLRCLEALFLEKKLITNNPELKNYEFYNSNNIFILEEDNLKNIKQFIDKSIAKIEKEKIEYYDFKNWINRFGGQ